MQGRGRQAVLTALWLQGRVGHAAGCCSQGWPSRLGGRRAAWGGSRLQGRARRSFRRGCQLEGQVRWAVRRGCRLEGQVGPAGGGCALPAGHPQARGAARWGGQCCLPSGTVASLQHRQSRANGHSAGEPGAVPSPQKHSPREQGCPWPQGLGTVPRSSQGRQWDPHPSPAAALVSGGAHAAPRCPTLPHAGCQAPGAQCTEGPAGALPGTAATKPPFFLRQLPPQPRCGTETPHRHGDPRASPPLSPEDAEPLPPALVAGLEAGWARAPRPDVTAPAHVPQRCAMPRPGPRAAMNSWPRNAHEAAAASKQPPPHIEPSHLLPRRGAGGGHAACSVHPEQSSPENCAPVPASPRGDRDPRGTHCTPQCWGWRGDASRPAKPQRVPLAKADVPGPPMVIPPRPPITSPLPMHFWARAGITALTPGSGQVPRNDARPALGAMGTQLQHRWHRCSVWPQLRQRGTAGTPVTGTHRPQRAALAAGDVMHRAGPCLQSSPQSSVRGKVWAL